MQKKSWVMISSSFSDDSHGCVVRSVLVHGSISTDWCPTGTTSVHRVYAAEVPTWLRIPSTRYHKEDSFVYPHSNYLLGHAVDHQVHQKYIHHLPLDGKYEMRCECHRVSVTVWHLLMKGTCDNRFSQYLVTFEENSLHWKIIKTQGIVLK